ncbi:BROMODOMAIN CONTAINING PROTEIN [Salix purpurea]|uniref:BROMODOMAIN CONTAINING PROTEIN n=1 Tax=Salix purpurea TaxID=77065 RepID=A0A9Q0W3I0_SALPP|nr:BROMODOMAIN CONTAINING PROTEIN [Salix purpurea]
MDRLLEKNKKKKGRPSLLSSKLKEVMVMKWLESAQAMIMKLPYIFDRYSQRLHLNLPFPCCPHRFLNPLLLPGAIHTGAGKKHFEKLRQDRDDNEREPKVARRGRPPSENLKKSPGRLSLDPASSELPPGATLATGGENKSSEKSGFPDLSGQSHGSRNEAYVWTESRFEKNDETAGSILEGKHIKKHLALDENSRSTQKQFHPSAGGRVPSVLNTFDAERKQLVDVCIASMSIFYLIPYSEK